MYLRKGASRRRPSPASRSAFLSVYASARPKPSPRTGKLRVPAAGGGRREPTISAAVEKCKDQRKPASFFGNCKADRWREAPDEVPAQRISCLCHPERQQRITPPAQAQCAYAQGQFALTSVPRRDDHWSSAQSSSSSRGRRHAAISREPDDGWGVVPPLLCDRRRQGKKPCLRQKLQIDSLISRRQGVTMVG